MREKTARQRVGLIVAIIAVGVALPLLWYDACIGRAPSIPAPAAKRLLNEQKAVLVDLGAAPELAMHLTNAVKWPLKSILETQALEDVPPALRGRKLLLVCTAGIQSARAALHLRRIGIDAASLRGGAQQYVCAVPGCFTGVLLHGNRETDAAIPAFREATLDEQWALVISFFGIKAVYTLITAGIVLMLWRRSEADLAAIRWSMILFFLGEGCCFLNVMFFFEDSLLLEHLHGVGMVLSLGFACYGILEGVDTRFVHYSSDMRCAMLGLCCVCDKHGATGCAL
jgi:rhodanese-related sulfurtransferase